MAEQPSTQAPKVERRVSVTITVMVDSLPQSEAMALENAVRDAADDYESRVTSSYDAERVFKLNP